MSSADVIVLSVKVAKQRKPRQLRKDDKAEHGADSQEPVRFQHVKQEVTEGIEADKLNQARQDQDHEEMPKVKDEVKEEVEDVKKEVKEDVQTEIETRIKEEQSRDMKEEVKEEMVQKDVKKEVKEEVSKDVQTEIETRIKEEQSRDMKEEVKEEMMQKVKEELSKDIEIKQEEVDLLSSPGMSSNLFAVLIAAARGRQLPAKTAHEGWYWSNLQNQLFAEVDKGLEEHGLSSLPNHSFPTGVKREQVCVKEEHAEQSGPIQEAKRRRLSQKSPDSSVPSFQSRVTEWAEKCLAFQSSGKTWLPTKPCCPASPFLGLAAAPWQGCEKDAAAACVQLLSKEQFRELRDFYHENPHHALFHGNSDPSSKQQTETTAGSRPQAHRSSTGNQHRAAECMKMWPWMRDLPTRAWAGNGWLLVEDGMMKLSPTGGGSAMQGLEIFESMGSVPEPDEPSSRAEPRAEEGQVITKCFRGLERQSGIQGIIWKREMACWRVQWQVAGKRKLLHFPISKHMKLGLSEAEAVEAALEEAKAFREELVRLGKLKPPRPVTEKASGSTVRGIKYNKNNGTFQVQMTDPSTKKLVHGGMFKVKEEAEARAREMFQKFWDEHHEVVPVKPLSEIPHFEPLGPEKGIRWSQQTWHAQINVAGEHRDLRVRPKDFSAKEVEKAWKQAVAWRKQQEKEKERIQEAQKRKR
ncbi:unnamed protein product [Symbiodinium sp. CCMP2456]|nr:unnamed protein product [Symbiodinium sp. CCMP2456]